MARTELGEALSRWAEAHAAAAERMRPVMEAVACIAQGAAPLVQMPDGMRAIGDAIAAAPLVQMPDGLRAIGDAIAAVTKDIPPFDATLALRPGIEAVAALAERVAPIFEAHAAHVRRLAPALQALPLVAAPPEPIRSVLDVLPRPIVPLDPMAEPAAMEIHA